MAKLPSSQPAGAWLRPRRPLGAMLVVAATVAALGFALAVTFGFIAS